VKKIIAVALMALFAIISVGFATPAQAVESRATSITAPITCAPNEDSCNIGYVVNGGNGYVMFQQDTGGQWVRASQVIGADNSHIPPITCKYSTSCVYDYVGGASFWRARQASVPAPYTWVQLTM